MKKLLGLLLIALPAWSHAQTREVSAFYAGLQGEWQAASTSERYQVTYALAQQGLHIQGQECRDSAYNECYFIEADYLFGDRGIMRNYPAYGPQQVEILRVTPTLIVKRETNPIDPYSYLIVHESLIDGSTLEVRREVWRKARGGDQSDKKVAPDDVVVLRRMTEPNAITSANTEAGGLIQ